MSQERKEKRELQIFQNFAKRSSLDIIPDSIENRPPPEPDIRCQLSDGETVAFELKELCEPSMAQDIDYLLKGGDYDKQRFWVGDPTEPILRMALKKRYETKHPMELVAYSDGNIGMPPNGILEGIQRVCDSLPHRFRRVWFMGTPGEPCGCVYATEELASFLTFG